MPNRPRTHRPAAAPAHAPREARGTAAQRGYGSRWQKARAAFLAEHTLCECRDGGCCPNGCLRAATVVDHIVPHKGDAELFWDSARNWRSLCKRCHDRATARYDGGFGRPIRPGKERPER